MAEGEGRELKADEGYSLNAGSAEGASLDLICLIEVGRETFFLATKQKSNKGFNFWTYN